MLEHGHSARGTGHILVAEVQCSCDSASVKYVHFFATRLRPDCQSQTAL